MRIKPSKSYLCSNQNCRVGEFFSLKEAEKRNYRCSQCLYILKLV